MSTTSAYEAEGQEKAEGAKEKVAGGLDRAADRLRQNVESMAPGGRGREALERVAGGMQSTADYVRKINLQAMGEDARAYVRQNPTNALLIAAGAGLLLGVLLARR